MIRFHQPFKFFSFCSLLLIMSQVGLLSADDHKVTIYRDVWGVPHIYADSEAAGAYGLGYAQAEDRLDDIYISLRTGLGLMAEAFGKKYVDQDYIMRLARNDSLSEEYWKTAPEEMKTMLTAFTAGIQAYADEHPDEVPEFAVKLEPWKILTIGRAMILRWPLGTIMDDLNAGKKKKRREKPPMGSNEWSVAPSRSADNVPILLSDPHLTWEGLAVMYEARVHAGDWNTSGFHLIGSPLMGIGHTNRIGLALTTGGPDTSDVYEIKIQQGIIPKYKYDGEWKTMRLEMFAIPVKGEKPVVRPGLYTHLGPLIEEPDFKTGKAFVGASPYFEQTGLLEQFYKMLHAQDAKELFQLIGMHQFNEQNIMFADVEGNIGYVRSGATPNRPDGYDWSLPVPGDTSKTAWNGLHPVEDLVHIFNPEQGYMQNCNISPENMMVGSPMTPDKYKKYIYNVSWDFDNPRGQRTVQFLENDDSVTKEDAISLCVDVHDVSAPLWQKELKTARDEVGRITNPDLNKAVQGLLEWDGQFTKDATVTVLYKFWRLKCGNELDLSPHKTGQPLTAATRKKMLTLMTQTINELKKKYGKWEMPWGEIHRVGRGGIYYPVGGTEFRSGDKETNFVETPFNVVSKEDPDHEGKFIASSGTMAMILMFFHKDHVESYSCTPWGQSGHKDSPHYMDQGEKLYSERKMKSTFWAKEELMNHLESEKELTVPEFN